MAFYLVQLPLTAHILNDGDGVWYELFEVTMTVLVVGDDPQQVTEEGYNSLPWDSTRMEYDNTIQEGFYISMGASQDCFIEKGSNPVAKEISEEVFTLLRDTLPVVQKEATPSV